MKVEKNQTGRRIAGLVAMIIRRPLLTVSAVLGLSAASLFYAATHLGINTDTADMISERLSWRQHFNEYRESFPVRDRNIVVVIDGSSGTVTASFARALVDALGEEPELFPSVLLPGSGEFFDRNGLLYLPLADVDELVDRLISASPMLGQLARDASGSGIVELLAEAFEREESRSPAMADRLADILAAVSQVLTASVADQRRPLEWSRLIGAEIEPATRQLLLVRPKLEFERVRPAGKAIERLREICDGLVSLSGNAIDVRLTGTLMMEHEELTSVTESAAAAGIGALVLVIIVLLWALRSLRLLLIAVLTLIAGLSLTAAFAALVVEDQKLNLLSVAFAVLYVGLGVDFILHFTLRLKELRAVGTPIADAIIDTARGVGTSLVICAVTTAVGFFAFIPTDFTGIAELGLISGAGMIISLMVSLTLLPSLFRLASGAIPVGGSRQRPAWRLRWHPPPRLTCLVAAAIALAALSRLPGLEFDGNPVHLRDPRAESILALQDLAADSEAPLYSLAVLVPDAPAADDLARSLRALATVGDVRSIMSLVPDDQDEKLLALDDLSLALGSTLARVEVPAGDPERLTSALERLVAAVPSSGAPGNAAAELGDSAAGWLAHARRLSAELRRAFAVNVGRDLSGNLPELLERLDTALKARAFGRDDLPALLRDQWISADGRQLVEIVPADDLNDNEAAARFVAEVSSVAPTATGLPVVYQEAARTIMRAFSLALIYAFVAVALLLLLLFRSVIDSLLVIVPVLFAAVVTAGISVLIDLPLNFANIIALPLLIGIGVDSGIHVVHRMRTEPPSDGDPLRTSTSRAVFASALTTVASFGNLAFSSHLGMASMGQLLTLGMMMSVTSVLVLLPALLQWSRPS